MTNLSEICIGNTYILMQITYWNEWITLRRATVIVTAPLEGSCLWRRFTRFWNRANLCYFDIKYTWDRKSPEPSLYFSKTLMGSGEAYSNWGSY